MACLLEKCLTSLNLSNPWNPYQFQVHIKLAEPVWLQGYTGIYTYKEWMEDKCLPCIYTSLHYKEEKYPFCWYCSRCRDFEVGDFSNSEPWSSCELFLFSCDWLASAVAMVFSSQIHKHSLEIWRREIIHNIYLPATLPPRQKHSFPPTLPSPTSLVPPSAFIRSQITC